MGAYKGFWKKEDLLVARVHPPSINESWWRVQGRLFEKTGPPPVSEVWSELRRNGLCQLRRRERGTKAQG